MDSADVIEKENKDYIIYHVVYGFIALFGLFILFYLVRTIYNIYKVREVNLEVIDNDADTERNSLSSRLSCSNRQEVDNNNAPDSERLRLQLDRLRRLLNRLNAMGTFSRDTIGDLSAHSMAYENNSTVASSDLSNFWSSIDFDDFEESTINESKFLRTPTEKSVSLSISDISLDTTEMNFDNDRRNLNTTSTASALIHHTNASDAIVQILRILNSMSLKSSHGTQRVNNNLTIEQKSNEYSNIQGASSSKYSAETAASQNSTMLSSSPETMHSKLSSPCTSNISDTLISTPEIKESGISSSEIKLRDNTLSSEMKLVEQLSKIIASNFTLSISGSANSKMSKAMSCEEKLSSSSKFKNILVTNLFTSKSLDFDKLLNSTSVSSHINTMTVLPTQLSEHVRLSKTMNDAVVAESNIKQSIINSKELSSELNFSKINPFMSDKTDLNRSLSHSSVSDTRLSSIPIQPNSKLNIAKKSQTFNPALEKRPYIEITIPEVIHSSESYSHQNDLNGECENSINRMMTINKKNVSSVSSKSLNLLSAVTETLKSTTSETEIKQTKYFSMLSPNLSYSGSDEFFSPTVMQNSPPVEEIDWKSPAEPTSTISLPSNFTPRSKNGMLSRSSCVFFTPPSPAQSSLDDAV